MSALDKVFEQDEIYVADLLRAFTNDHLELVMKPRGNDLNNRAD